MKSLAELEEEISEAAVVPEAWPAVLAGLGQATESVGAVLFSNTEKDQRWISSPSLHARMECFVADGWIGRNTRATNGFRKGLMGIPRFHTDNDFYDGDDYERDPLYLEYFRPNGMGWSAGTAIALPHGDILTLSVERAYAAGPLPEAALLRLNELRPHLARSAMLAARLSFKQASTAVETLSRLGLSAAAVDWTGRLMVANREFDAEKGWWTTRGRDRLALFDGRADKLFVAALSMIATEQGIRSIPLLARETHAPSVLHIVPVRRSAFDLFARASAIVVLTKPVGHVAGANSLLQALFDLSATEAGIASRIAAGQTIEEIAMTEGKSLLTARQQLKTVLGKTGCHRQLDLAVLLTRLLPPSL